MFKDCLMNEILRFVLQEGKEATRKREDTLEIEVLGLLGRKEMMAITFSNRN